MNYFSIKKDQFSFEIIFLNLTILFYLFRTSIPFFKYPFLFLYACVMIYSFTKFHNISIKLSLKFAKNYILLLIISAILIIAFLFSNKLYLTIFKDVINLIILFSFFYFMTIYLVSKEKLKYFFHNLFIQIVIFSILISLNGIFDILNIFSDIDISVFTGFSSNQVTIPKIDNNIGILPPIFGIVVVLYYIFITDSLKYYIINNIILIIFSISIFFSSSRRGLIFFVVIFFFLLSIQILRFLKNESFLKKLAIKSRFFIYNIIVLLFFICYIIFFTSNSFKNRTLEFIGSKNLLDTRVSITNIICRYTTIFNETSEFTEVYNLLWSPEFDPNDPESSWGTRNHKNIYPLIGENVEIVPKTAGGYYLDSTCNASQETTYCDAYSLITELDVKKGDRYIASVYCFVSKDFDGDSVMLVVPFVSIKNQVVYGNTRTYYDLESKNIWKKLEIDFSCNPGKVPIYINFLKKGVRDFSKLKGYVIFAYPSYQKIESNICVFKYYDKNNKYLNESKNIFDLEYFLLNRSNSNIIKSNHFFYKVIHSNKRRESVLNDFVNVKKNESSFALIPFNIEAFLPKFNQDYIRNLSSSLIKEDTVYLPYNAHIEIDTISNQLSESRIVRWNFAIQIFVKEYNWKQKIVGNGFDFLNWYGNYFLKDKTKCDWPHNPFLSILLYSGIIGLLLYLFLIYKVFYYYIRNVKEYPIPFFLFLISLFFSFFSGGSPFDPPIMGFFMMLPFFIHYVHQKESIKEKV